MTELHPETPTRDPFDFPLATKEVAYRGVTYTFRELTVAENDEAREAALDPDTSKPLTDRYDGRLHMRMMIILGAVEPKIDLENLSKFPQRLYAKVVDVVSDLNDEGTLEDDEKDPLPS